MFHIGFPLVLLLALVLSMYAFVHPNLLGNQLYVTEGSTNDNHVVTRKDLVNKLQEDKVVKQIRVSEPLNVVDDSTLVSRGYSDSRYVLRGDDLGLTASESYVYKEVSSSTYTALSSDFVIGANTTSNTVTITLPKISGKKQYYIVDSGNNAGTNNITINCNASDSINGATTIGITGDGNSLIFISDGVSKWFLF